MLAGRGVRAIPEAASTEIGAAAGGNVVVSPRRAVRGGVTASSVAALVGERGRLAGPAFSSDMED